MIDQIGFRDGKRPNKYEYMDKADNTDHSTDGKSKIAHTIAKTQRALHGPLNHLVPRPKDEKLIDDDSPHSSNLADDNIGVHNDSYQFNSKEASNRMPSNKIPVTDTRHKLPTDKQPQSSSNQAVNVKIRRNPTGNQYDAPSRPKHQSLPMQSSTHLEQAHHSNNQYPKDYNHVISLSETHNYSDLGGISDIYNNSNSAFSRGRGNDSLVNVDARKLPKKGDILSFHEITYKVAIKKYPWSKRKSKTILNNISGVMMPGVNAIMGPTGSGKSSLLDVLACRKDPIYLDGRVLINGLKQPKTFKCTSGYVVQDDIVMGTLTVKENLMFSAALRLPKSIKQEQKDSLVMNIIEELGLTAVSNSKIGTELIRGVSGGERKRTNIGMELITDPKILFLDEPTTGLDAFTAASVVKTLQRLSRKGKTIVLSIHQPKYSIYKLFDRYTLMAKGQIIYHGKAGSAPINYFHNLGYYIEPHNNPADFFIDVLNGEVKNEREILDQQRLESSGEYSDVKNLGRSKSNVSEKRGIVDKLSNNWLDSNNRKELRNQMQSYDAIPEEDSLNHVKKRRPKNIFKSSHGVQYATDWFNQLKWVCWRTALNLLRNPQTSTIQLGVYLFFAFSMGIVYFGLSTECKRGPQDRYGLFFFSALQVMFVNLGAIEVFIKERPIFIHENSSGYYRVSSYFLAKLICDMVPIKVIPAIVFLPITYFMAKLRADAATFFFFELILLLTTAAGCSIAFFTSATFSVFGLANVVTPIIYVFMMVFSGYLISINSIFSWLNWCEYLSAFRYALAGLSIMELKDQSFENSNCTQEFLSKNGIEYTSAWNLWVNPFGLLMITMFFLLLCYVQLRRINKYK